MADLSIDDLKQKIRAKRGPAGVVMTVAQRRASMEDGSFRVADDIDVETVTAADRGAEWLCAPQVDRSRAVLYLHGGGYVMGSLNTHRALCGAISRASNAAVLHLDYRLGPESPFPAAVEDAVAAYEWLLSAGFAPKTLAIAGDSAGGGLVIACLLALRERGIALPACAVSISPWSDLTCTNASYESRADADPMVTLSGISQLAGHYLGDQDPKHPLASPNFADLTSLPPILIHVGADEVLLDDALKLHDKAQAAGVNSTLEVWDDMIHVWHAFHPLLKAGREGVDRVGEYIREQWTN